MVGDPSHTPPPPAAGLSSAVWTASAGAESPTLTGGRLSRRQSWNSSQGEAISLRDLGPVLVQDPDTPSPDDEHDIGLGVRNDFSTPVRRFHTAGSHSPTAYADSSGDEGDMQRLTPNGPDAARASPAGRRVYDGDGRARASPISLMARSPTVRRLSNTFHLASRSVSTYIGSDKGGAYGLMRTSDEAQPFSSSNDNVAVGITQSPSTPPSGMPPSPSAGLRGRTLGIFSARNPLRRAMDRLLRFSLTEPLILILILFQAIVLIIQSAKVPVTTPRPAVNRSGVGYFLSWEDWVIFVLFIIFTIEMFGRIIVTGLLIDPETTSRQWIAEKWDIVMRRAKAEDDPTQPKRQDTWQQQQQRRKSTMGLPMPKPKRSITHTNILVPETPFQKAVARQHDVVAQNRPYLRHSWHRIDMLSIIMFWITFILAITKQESTAVRHLFIFRALSVLRTARLIVITSGTATILHSLKRAGPLLLNVSVFIVFAAALFSIIGVQSFRGSLRRTCVLLPTNVESEPTYLNNTCGGWIDPQTLKEMSYFLLNSDQLSTISPKGYLCPIGQQCQTVSWSQENDVVSFDNIFLSLIQVLVIAGVNTWTSTMYSTMAAEYFSSCLFFIVAIIVLNFWLMNLLVAVVVNTFKDIRNETKASAFGADVSMMHQPEWASGTKKPQEPSWLLKWYNKTQLVWVILVVVDLVSQAFRDADSSQRQLDLLRDMGIGFAIVWDVEMIIRMAAYFPDYKGFLRNARNDADLFLAVGCSIIQIPVIRRSSVYPWLTILQLLRWYRFILVFPRMRPLLTKVFGSFAGMLNMVLFLFLMNFLSALMAIQLLRGDLYEDPSELINFSQTYNSFLGMYQIFSTENWTTILYNSMGASWQWDQAWIVCIFLMLWFMFANFILMQMFIAVINENFEVAEELKRKEQIDAFVRKTEPTSTHVNWIERLNPYRLIRARHKTVKVEELPPNLILPLKQSIGADVGAPSIHEDGKGAKAAMRRLFALETLSDAMPLRRLNRALTAKELGPSPSMVDVNQDFDDDYDDDRGLTDLLPPLNSEGTVDEHMDALREQRNQQADFISAHPSYDKSLWLFSQKSEVRQVCQAIVPPSYGERIYGRPAIALLSLGFRFLLFLAVIASVSVFGFATPHYRRDYYAQHGYVRTSWFEMTEMALGSLFLIEAVIKIIADGFIFAPNAYLLSTWNFVDFVILVTIIINTICSFIVVGGVSRATRALKAFRALRFITLFSRLRDTFHAVFFAGALRILDASILMILYIIPFAVWGLNIFNGRLTSCNDGDASGLVDCVSEYMASPVGNVQYLAPRVWANPSFSGSIWTFDSFRQSMLILFEIVSLEGWIDVMSSAMDIVGMDMQPSTNNQQWNSLFFVIFNLFGGVIILTVFLSIIIENFSIRSGSALLTSEQNQWADLKKFIRQQTPSQLPRARPKVGFRAWCYDRAVKKRGWWTRSFTVLYFVHIVLLMMLNYQNRVINEVQLDWIFLALTILYAIDIVVRFTGLGLNSFRSNGWNLFDVIVVTGSFATTIPALQASLHNAAGSQASKQVQKLFLVSIALKLVQRLDSLNQLFKTSVASLPAIGNLFLLWAVVFIFMAIVMTEIFGLTRQGPSVVSVYQNFHDFASSLVMLAFMSTGEGWNAFMHDYTVEFPRCTQSDNWMDDDCGSVGWAYILFIFWNILSMYIFLNMFTGVVVQSFAYVYQSPGGASLTREQIRAFKRVWAEIDTDRTGYIRRKDFTRFFNKLSGVFEVRLYPTEQSIPNLLRNAVPDSDTPMQQIITGANYSVDTRKLRHQMAKIDYTKVRRRRRQYVRLFNEAKMSQDPRDPRGVSFTAMLLMLAHYTLIDDEKALRVDELLVRRAKVERVEDLVNLDRVRGLLRTIYWRRRFLRVHDEKRMLEAHNTGTIPAIVLDGTEAVVGFDKNGDPLQGYTASTPSILATVPEQTPPPAYPYDTPPRVNTSGLVNPFDVSVSAASSNASYNTALSPTGERARRSIDSRTSSEVSPSLRASVIEEDSDDIMNAMSASAWAGMMAEAVDEEERE